MAESAVICNGATAVGADSSATVLPGFLIADRVRSHQTCRKYLNKNIFRKGRKVERFQVVSRL